jgi:serine protease Do
MTTSLAALDGYEKSAGYAIPFDHHVRRMIDDLMRGYEVEYGLLGIIPEDNNAEELQTEFPSVRAVGAAVAREIYANSPAARAGLLPRDLIVAINNEPMLNKNDLMRVVGLIGPDATAVLRVWRERPVKEFVTISVKLGKWPVADDEGIIATNVRHAAWRGLSVDYCTGRERYLSEPLRYYRAVVVTETPSTGEAGDLKIKRGDLISHVNGTPVTTPAEFYRAAEKVEGEVTLTLVDERKVVIPK